MPRPQFYIPVLEESKLYLDNLDDIIMIGENKTQECLARISSLAIVHWNESSVNQIVDNAFILFVHTIYRWDCTYTCLSTWCHSLQVGDWFKYKQGLVAVYWNLWRPNLHKEHHMRPTDNVGISCRPDSCRLYGKRQRRKCKDLWLRRLRCM